MTQPFNERPGSHPYRGADTSTIESEPSHDEMMIEMRCQVEGERYPSPGHWEAKILWMERDGCRAFLVSKGKEPTAAVCNLYADFKRMQQEGWKRST